MPHRDRYLFVCLNRRSDDHPKGSCAQRGSEALVNKLKEAVVTRRAKEAVRICTSSCLDLCEIGASMVQEPDHVAYGHVTLADVDELADALVAGTVVERLVIHGRRA
jgi:(2Fe-2S) ferredoxin